MDVPIQLKPESSWETLSILPRQFDKPLSEKQPLLIKDGSLMRQSLLSRGHQAGGFHSPPPAERACLSWHTGALGLCYPKGRGKYPSWGGGGGGCGKRRINSAPLIGMYRLSWSVNCW